MLLTNSQSRCEGSGAIDMWHNYGVKATAAECAQECWSDGECMYAGWLELDGSCTGFRECVWGLADIHTYRWTTIEMNDRNCIISNNK